MPSIGVTPWKQWAGMRPFPPDMPTVMIVAVLELGLPTISMAKFNFLLARLI